MNVHPLPEPISQTEGQPMSGEQNLQETAQLPETDGADSVAAAGGLSPRRQKLQTPLLGGAVVVIAVAGWLVWSTMRSDGLSGTRAGSWPSPFDEFDLSNSTVPREEIAHGGPPVDGIPSLTEPEFLSAEDAGYLEPEDRVIGLVAGGEARAYPLKVLDYHEAVNDRIGQTDVAVTYCPLCDSAAVFDRQVGDDVLEFGISGLLYNSNVLLYDRRENSGSSLWSQLQGGSVAGPLAKTKLQTLPFELTTWQDWSVRYPQTKVLSTDTGYGRDYSRSPYAGYFEQDRLMFPVKSVDERLPVKSRVLGIWTQNAARAWPLTAFTHLKEPTTITDRIGDAHVTLVYDPAAKSLRVTDADEGVQWMYSLWFAWAAFHPETEIYSASRPGG
jgi:hypothetical protein